MITTRRRPVKNFVISEEAEAYLEQKAAQGFSRSRLVSWLIEEAAKKEQKEKEKKPTCA